MDTTNWTYTEYLTYFLLFAANEDYEVNEEELNWIIDRVGEWKYKKINQVYQANTETNHLNIVHAFGEQYCQDEAAKEKIMVDLKQLFMSDGKFSDLEQVLYVGLGKLI